MLQSRIRADGGRNEMEIREAASTRQQRRMKQAVQFIHKDSADLLPLDGLKKLGTSKETQPLNILQRRLLETNLSRCRLNNRGTKPPNNGIGLLSIGSVVKQKDSLLQENDHVFVWCKCSGRDMKVLIDTGCRLNLLSSASVEWLGLKEMVNANKMEAASLPSHRNLRALGQIDKLSLAIGQVHVESTMTVVENEKHFMSLGTRTLKALKCVIDMEKQTLMLGKVEREIVQFVDGKIGSQDESPSQV